MLVGAVGMICLLIVIGPLLFLGSSDVIGRVRRGRGVDTAGVFLLSAAVAVLIMVAYQVSHMHP